MRAPDPQQTWAKRTYRLRSDCERTRLARLSSVMKRRMRQPSHRQSLLAHLRNSRTNRMDMVSPKVGMTTDLWLPSATCPIPSRDEMCPVPPTLDRLRLSDPMCEACRLPPGD
jgi:hypothetical protein